MCHPERRNYGACISDLPLDEIQSFMAFIKWLVSTRWVYDCIGMCSWVRGEGIWTS